MDYIISGFKFSGKWWMVSGSKTWRNRPVSFATIYDI